MRSKAFGLSKLGSEDDAEAVTATSKTMSKGCRSRIGNALTNAVLVAVALLKIRHFAVETSEGRWCLVKLRLRKPFLYDCLWIYTRRHSFRKLNKITILDACIRMSIPRLSSTSVSGPTSSSRRSYNFPPSRWCFAVKEAINRLAYWIWMQDLTSFLFVCFLQPVINIAHIGQSVVGN